MPEGYLHLTCEQRCQIYALLQSGRSQAHIARQIGVDPSTISRELVRNTGARGYRFKQAHEKASQRRQEASDKPRKMTPDLVELIEEKLTQEQWSPDQISGRLAKDGVAFISHERIYQHVWKDKKDGGTLYLHLRHSGKKYNRRKGKNSGRGLIPNRVDIDQRPPIVAAKSRIGDWEADTIIGANHKGVVMSHVERTSKYTKLAKLPDKNADSVVQACARVLLPLADQIETITYDNGKEFASHAQIATSLGALSYFAKPYHSRERGLKGSRTNSTLAPERYSATKPLARFSSAPEICPLHFTVEWAYRINSSRFDARVCKGSAKGLNGRGKGNSDETGKCEADAALVPPPHHGVSVGARTFKDQKAGGFRPSQESTTWARCLSPSRTSRRPSRARHRARAPCRT